MTDPKVAARLLEEAQEREQKKKKKVTGPVTRSMAGPSGVSITMRSTTTSAAAKRATSGTLDDFVTRRPKARTEEQQQQDVQYDLTQTPRPLVQKTLQNFLPDKSQSTQSRQREDSLYRDTSTTEESECDPDDPYPLSDKVNLY